MIKNGAEVDTRNGVVEITRSDGGVAKFYDGIFKLSPVRRDHDDDLEPEAHRLPEGQQGARARPPRSPRSRKLWGDGKGKFRTKGSYSAATIRGTKWLVQDTCTSTLTRVTQGSVLVRDLVKKRNVIVRKGRPLHRPSQAIGLGVDDRWFVDGLTRRLTSAGPWREARGHEAEERMRWKRMTIGVVGACLAIAPAAQAAQFTVTGTADVAGSCTGSECTSIRAALGAISSGDQVTLQPGTYQLASPLVLDTPVALRGDTARNTTITAAAGARALLISANATISHLTVTGGTAPNDFGGNILAQSVTVSLDQVKVTNGRAGTGGGIANRNGDDDDHEQPDRRQLR